MIGERALRAEIFDEEVDNDRDVDDYIVQSWKNRIFIDKKRVFLPMLYDIDVHAQRKVAAEKEEVEKEVAEEDEERGGEEEAANEEPQVVSTSELEKMKKEMFDLKDAMLKMNKSMEDGFLRLTNLMSGQDKRLKEVESFVKLQTTYDSHFDPGTTAGYDAGTTPFGGGDAVGTPVGGDDIAVETAVGGNDAGQSEPVKEGEEGEECDEEDSEEGEEGNEGDSEEGKKDNIAGEKRKIKPSDAKKHPYTTLTEEKKKRKKAKTTQE